MPEYTEVPYIRMPPSYGLNISVKHVKLVPDLYLVSLERNVLRAEGWSSLVMADFFMEHFEEDLLRTAQYKLKYWFRYVDDTFIVWPQK